MIAFTYAKCCTAGLIAFGVNGATNHYASRSEIQRALTTAELGDGWASCGELTVHRDNLVILLNALGTEAT